MAVTATVATPNLSPQSSGGRESPLQAVLLIDCLDESFHPITLEHPKVLMPLVNVPLIDYTLDWLQSAGVQQVFVLMNGPFDDLILSHLRKSRWLSQRDFALQFCLGKELTNLINGDFILVSGDTVSDMSFKEALQEHKDRRKKDPFALMTMVITESYSDQSTHKSSLGTDELYMDIDYHTNQLLHYQCRKDWPYIAEHLQRDLRSKYAKNPSTKNMSPVLYNNKRDCYIDICSYEMCNLFASISDWQRHRSHFVKELLEGHLSRDYEFLRSKENSDVTQYKIFTHKLKGCYAARVDNLRGYCTISNEIIRSWRRPKKCDHYFGEVSACELNRQERYRASEMTLTHSPNIGDWAYSAIGKNTILGDYKLLLCSFIGERCIFESGVSIQCGYMGNGVTIGKNTRVDDSIIGESCVIGSDVSIKGCMIWNNVTIEDGCKLKDAFLCDGVELKSGVVLNPGVVLSFNVVVGQNVVVPAYSKGSVYSKESVSALTPTAVESNSRHTASKVVGPGWNTNVWTVGDESLLPKVSKVPAYLLPLYDSSMKDDDEDFLTSQDHEGDYFEW